MFDAVRWYFSWRCGFALVGLVMFLYWGGVLLPCFFCGGVFAVLCFCVVLLCGVVVVVLVVFFALSCCGVVVLWLFGWHFKF